MISREEKNKKLNDEVKYEKTINISKKIFKFFFLIILLFAIFFFYAYFIGIKGIKTHEYVINDTFPNSFDGIKILHFTDLLYGKTINKESIDFLKKEFDLINPDIVFFTGNLIDNDYKLSEDEINELSLFMKNIPYKIGKYAIRGNLDTTNFDLIMDNTDFNILDNEVSTVYNNSQEAINIIGININKNISIDNKNDIYTITLINNYDKYNNYNIKSNLVLAGNNLGGEIKLFNIPVLGNNKYMNSYYNENNTKIYISNGLGSLHHLRFMNHPSINVYRFFK